MREGREAGDGVEAFREDGEEVVDAQCHHLQRSDQRAREGVRPERPLELFASTPKQRLTPEATTHNASISAGDKGVRPERALELFEATQSSG